MKKSELVNRIHAQKPLLFRYQVEKLVTAILDEIASAIARGDRVELRGFGAFFVRARPPYVGRNPKTGTEVPVSTKVKPRFKPSKEMHHRLNPTAEAAPEEAAGR
jgi:integration host factor subunit beta